MKWTMFPFAVEIEGEFFQRQFINHTYHQKVFYDLNVNTKKLPPVVEGFLSKANVHIATKYRIFWQIS